MEGSQQLEVDENAVNDVDSSFLIALEELRNLRPQLLTAAEYCEQQYLTSEQKDSVTGNLRDYAVKALVNMVDHLGTVSYKLNLCIDQETSRAETLDVQLMTLQQRIASMRTYMEQDAAKQQQQPKAAQRMVKQYRVPDATAEAAFATAQFLVEMPRERFEFEERNTSESFYSPQPVMPARRSTFGRRRSEPLPASREPLRRASSVSYQAADAPGSPSSTSTIGGDSTTRSTGGSRARGSHLDRSDSGPVLRQHVGEGFVDVESVDLSVSGTQTNRSTSKLRRMFSRVLSRKESEQIR
ncbi:hypothetical protein KFL_000610310 [Klebsormidium nitens]|uniref:Uncharacterized protein n=1 Tax=Klebsormidium nitens TaxID=105231 RepID=A0A0U9HIP4_KLENI|nr:hypothetical protein KFL_000610310 [Klebsormidium nitens]|eukprot:GAQ80753.1 hypothetical protein KFL_000610310 [Klebsormidium nitens]